MIFMMDEKLSENYVKIPLPNIEHMLGLSQPLFQNDGIYHEVNPSQQICGDGSTHSDGFLTKQSNWTYWSHNPHLQNRKPLKGFQRIESKVPYRFQDKVGVNSNLKHTRETALRQENEINSFNMATYSQEVIKTQATHSFVRIVGENTSKYAVQCDPGLGFPYQPESFQTPEPQTHLMSSGYTSCGFLSASDPFFSDTSLGGNKQITSRPTIATCTEVQPAVSSCYYSAPILYPIEEVYRSSETSTQKVLYQPVLNTMGQVENGLPINTSPEKASQSFTNGANQNEITPRSMKSTVVQDPPKCIDGTAFMNVPLAKGMTQVRTATTPPLPSTPSRFAIQEILPEGANMQVPHSVPMSSLNTSPFNYFRPLAAMPTEQRMPISIRIGILQLNLIRLSRSYQEEVKNIELRYQTEATAIETARYHMLYAEGITPSADNTIDISELTKQQDLNNNFDKQHHDLLDQIEDIMKELEDPNESESSSSSINLEMDISAGDQGPGKKVPYTRSRSRGRGKFIADGNQMSARRYGSVYAPYKRPRPAPLSTLSIRIMDTWYERNKSNPYPTHETAEVMSKAGGITVEQVKKWFANKRVRSGNTKSIKEIAKKRRKGACLAEQRSNIQKIDLTPENMT